MHQQVRFCTSTDGVRLAYAITGNGPPIVRSPHWFTHLEHDWNNPAMRAWVDDLSKRYTVLRFDQRGTGLSDREVPEISFEAHVRDLEAVIDASGFERFAMLGLSQGAASGIAYAANHPGRAKRSTQEMIEQREMQVKLIQFGWDRADPSFRQVFTSQFMPDAPIEAIHGFNDFMPLTSSAKNAAEIFSQNSYIDVQEEARRVK